MDSLRREATNALESMSDDVAQFRPSSHSGYALNSKSKAKKPKKILPNHRKINAARNLLLLKSKIDTERMKAPSFLMILTATEYGYKREDGVYLAPIGCIKD